MPDSVPVGRNILKNCSYGTAATNLVIEEPHLLIPYIYCKFLLGNGNTALISADEWFTSKYGQLT